MKLKWKILTRLSKYEYYEIRYHSDADFKSHVKDMMNIGWKPRRIDRPEYSFKTGKGWFPMRVIWMKKKGGE